jgi:hypothetical protein
MKSITSLSGGKSSAYMAIHWPTDYTLFSCVLTDDPALAPKDPGVLRECQRRIPGFIGSTEVELTLLNLLKLEEMIGREITWVCAYEGQSRASWIGDPADGWMPRPLTFDQVIRHRGGLPDKTKRWCTDELKVRAIWWHIHNHILDTPDDLVWMHIGYRADERHRWEKLRRCEANQIQYPTHCPIDAKDKRAKHRHRTHEYRIPHCPMIDVGIDQLDVMKFWADKGWQWPLVSNCAHCFYHDDSELQHVNERYPAHLQWAIRKEEERGARWDSQRTLTQRLSTHQDELFPSREFACFCTD